VAQVEPAGHLALASGNLAARTHPRDGQQGSHRDQQLATAGLLQQQPVPTDIEQTAPYRAGALADQTELATRRRAQAVLEPEQPGLPSGSVADLARELGCGQRIGRRLEVGEHSSQRTAALCLASSNEASCLDQDSTALYECEHR